MCAFLITWDETSPTNGTVASNIDDEFRNLKISLRERLKGNFTDWDSATDRIHAEKFFAHSVNGLKVRDATDASDLLALSITGNLSIAGSLTEVGRPICFVSRTSVHSSLGALTAVTFTSELLDQGNMFDLAGQPTRLVAPVAGKYIFFAYIRWQQLTDNVGNKYLDVDWRKNGTTSTMHYTNNFIGSVDSDHTLQTSEFRPWIENLNANDYLELRIGTSSNATCPAVFAGGFKIG